MSAASSRDPVGPLRRAALRLQQDEAERNRLLRSLRSQRTPITRLAEAANLSVGTVHRLTRPATIVSIGYEGRSVETFVDELVAHGVGVVVDVRENAISRKRGFSKRALGEACSASGIDYRHERELGNPRSNRDGFRAADRASVEFYRRHLATQGAQALDRVSSLLKDRTVALLCFEEDPCACHRSIVAEELRAADPLVKIQLV
jgi:hypothetical protein